MLPGNDPSYEDSLIEIFIKKVITIADFLRHVSVFLAYHNLWKHYLIVCITGSLLLGQCEHVELY